jgi:energy-coupling factor transporter ATP-binding protein EcfA2
MHDQASTEESPTIPGSAPAPPTVAFESLTFSDGSVLHLRPNDIIVFVGPNNAGKSATLAELESLLVTDPNFALTIIQNRTLTRTGDSAQLRAYLAENARTIREGKLTSYSGLGYKFGGQDLDSQFHEIGNLRSFYCSRIGTQERITFSNEQGNIDHLRENPSHPHHVLIGAPETERRISGYFRRAFRKDLYILRERGRIASLYVGERPAREANQDDGSYLEKCVASGVPLDSQGDGMRSFASVALKLLTTRAQSVLLLDEPEAFLHPPQARLLGEFIATERPETSQLFVATHSVDVLQGLLSSPKSHQLRIIRMIREGNINRVCELSNDQVKAIASDSLMQYSGVLNGMFHERAIICESDSDCLFYHSVLSVPEVRGDSQPDVVFVHGAGKARLARLAKALSSLNVRVDVIVDIDVLNEGLKQLVDALGVDWSKVDGLANSIRQAVRSGVTKTPTATLKSNIQALLANLANDAEFPDEAAEEITKLLKKASPWKALKTGGKASLPAGQASVEYAKLDELCVQRGLWITPVGELEGWKKTQAGHGPAWVQSVVGREDFATDPELGEARAFIRRLWTRQPTGP